MRALLLTVVVLFGAIGSLVAQKKNTLIGDLVIGELAGIDEATREITLKYPGEGGTEIFIGFLVDDYKLKLGENNLRDLKLSELVPGMHIRAFYKTGNAKVGGQEKKINKIRAVQVLGNDKYFRIRNQLNLDASMAITHADQNDLPAASPLRVFLAISVNPVHQQLLEWIDKWNRKHGDSIGKLEVVNDLGQADTLVVVARGADTMVGALPMLGPDGREAGVWTQATSYLVVKDAGNLKVLWTGIAGVFSGAKAEVSPKTTELVTAEMEKRLKARAGNSKK